MNKLETLASVLSNLSGSPVVSYAQKPVDVNDCIVYRLISSKPIRSHSGSLLELSHVQIDVYGFNLTASRNFASTVKSKLDCDVTDFTLSYLDNDFILPETDVNIFRSVLEFYIL